ncbi:MAG: response regulator [Ktedonobacterales bacterium]
MEQHSDNSYTTRSAHRILVIDDDPTLIALITDSLRLVGGYEVIAATDGASGLERYFEMAPDCVVVDIRMPGLNGFQFLHAMRGDPQTADIPIIVLSALAQDHYEMAGMLAGADTYILKPVKMVDLLDAVTSVMRLSPSDRRERNTWLSGGSAPEGGIA